MSLQEFQELENPHDHLYNVVRKNTNTVLLRGADVNGVYKMVKLCGEDNVLIYIY